LEQKVVKQQKILVTGGAGFIGWRASRILADKGHQVAVLDNLHVGMPMPVDHRLATYPTDIRKTVDVLNAFQAFKPDTIIHLAAIHHIPTCERERAFAQDVNIVGTENILAAAEKTGVGTIVLASSGAVYEWLDGPLNEDKTALRPCDNYALCKLTNEHQLKFWGERTGGRVRIARIFNTIGHDDPNAHLIPDILNQLNQAKGEVTIQLGNLAPRRDYIHAEDTAAGVVALGLDHSSNPFDVMNVATGQDVSVGELVQMIGDAMGVAIRIESDPTRVRRVDRLSQLGDVRKIKTLLGWSAQVSLQSAVANIVKNFSYSVPVVATKQ
jgi:nucleoside-diphosphate-sugar epimerase